MKVISNIFNVIAKMVIGIVVTVGISTLLLIAYGMYVLLTLIA